MSRKPLASLGACVVTLALAAGVLAQTPAMQDGKKKTTPVYAQTNLVTSGKPLKGKVRDKNLLNPWGLVQGHSPFWISDNNAGVSTLYDGNGKIVNFSKKVPFVVTIPPPTNSTATAAPTGLVFNGTPADFTGDAFIFSTEDGTISAWAGGLNPADNAVIAADESANGAVYKGLAFAVNVKGAFLYATNFHNGTVDVFGPNGADGLFTKVTLDGQFADPELPPGYAPFNIANIDGDLFVTYAKQNDQKHDDVAGPGNGFVDVFDTDGHLIRRFDSRGRLNSPWGIARASFAFGPFSGKILVGNFGDGRINVFDNDGTLVDQLEDVHGKPLVIDRLWTLTLGGGRNSSPDTLYFSAGPNDETNGLFGTITLAPSQH